ncbi:MAG: carboxylating nicotinate-nucleotide diphosphorylase [Puniceicoccaceae bacterium]
MSAPLIADRIAFRLSWEDLDPSAISSLVRMARAEDLAGFGLARQPAQSGDVTSKALGKGDQPASARLMAREDLVVSGLPLIPLILSAYGEGGQFKAAVEDGQHCPTGTSLGTLKGPSGLLLQAERVLLNFLQKLSGVASMTHRYVDALGDSPTRLLDTRKTTPGFRVLEKYAVACGGGFNHRIGLFDRVMLKDNHLAAEGAQHGPALADLVRNTRGKWPELLVELEVDALEQIPPGLGAGVDVFLLDNFQVDDLRKAVGLIGQKAATEASGGITLDNLPTLANIGLDFISTGATVHQSTWKDIGLDWN